MLKYILVPIFLLVLGIGYFWFFYAETDQLPQNVNSNLKNDTENPETATTTKPVDDQIIRTPSSPDRQVYINQKWRFSFEYPKGWEIREPAFGSASSLFNLAVWPEAHDAFDPVTINITPKWWMDRVLETSAKDKKVATAIVGRPGWTYPSVTMSVLLTQEYLVLINDEYWINISIQDEFAPELQMVLDTFELHDPPTLKEIGVEPKLP